MKRKDPAAEEKRLINHLVPDPDWGACLGFIQTTYEFSPEFYEIDYLPSLLGLGAWDDRHWTTRVAMEKELHGLKAAVLMDCDGYHGRPRSLRVEVLPGRGDGRQRLHAKVSLLVYEKRVRLLVGSSNLTEPGYRRNVECMAVLEAGEGRPDSATVILHALEGFEVRLEPWLAHADSALLADARKILAPLAAPESDPDTWFCWGGGSEPVWRQVVDRWPAEERILSVTIVSPFWSEDAGRGPLMTFLAGLRSRDILAEKAELLLVTRGKAITDSLWKPELPPGYAGLDFKALGVQARAQAFDPKTPVSDERAGGPVAVRDLHAKVVVLANDRVSLAYMGSANFTNRGWGFSGGAANIEAGLILLRRGQDRQQLADLVPAVIGEPVFLGEGNVDALAAPVVTKRESCWPWFVRDVRLAPREDDPARLGLLIEVADSVLEGAWAVAYVDDDAWRVPLGRPTSGRTVAVDLSTDVLERLLRDQEIRICWWENEKGVRYPLNVHPDARDHLPVNPDSRGPTEKMLLAYYQGRITYSDLFPPVEPEAGGSGEGQDNLPSGVDTSRIQSYQMREFVESLEGLRQDLRKAASSARSMRMALLGPVSPVMLSQMVTGQVKAAARSPIAGAFQLLEIMSCLLECREYEKLDEWRSYLEEALNKIHAQLEELKSLGHADFKGKLFRRYEKIVLDQFDVTPKVES
jgi:hypothetical protein